MSYQVLARKWRPGKFEDLVGQEHVVTALTSALENNRLHHAYLFTGTRGVGKTTIARILSKSLNCETQAGASPCGKCPTCLEIDQGRYVDLLEIDAASRTKVEDTRELLDNVQYKPTRGRYKVYLIDEVHMLSKHSFNALLKTLEEPPEHVKFLLATTDPQKLPVTILSRCLQFNLKALSREQIGDRLSYVLNHEQIPFDVDGVKQLARAAMGSLRDALSLTDQAIAQGGGQVTATTVIDMLGLMDKNQVLKLVNALVSQAKEDVFAMVEQFVEQAADLGQVLSEIASTLHQIALTQFVPDVCKLETLSPKGIYQLAKQVSPEQIQLLYQIALQGKRDIQWAPDPRTGLEMTLLRMLAFSPERKLAPLEPGELAAITPQSANVIPQGIPDVGDVADETTVNAVEHITQDQSPAVDAAPAEESEDASSLSAMQAQQDDIEAQARALGHQGSDVGTSPMTDPTGGQSSDANTALPQQGPMEIEPVHLYAPPAGNEPMPMPMQDIEPAPALQMADTPDDHLSASAPTDDADNGAIESAPNQSESTASLLALRRQLRGGAPAAEQPVVKDSVAASTASSAKAPSVTSKAEESQPEAPTEATSYSPNAEGLAPVKKPESAAASVSAPADVAAVSVTAEPHQESPVGVELSAEAKGVDGLTEPTIDEQDAPWAGESMLASAEPFAPASEGAVHQDVDDEASVVAPSTVEDLSGTEGAAMPSELPPWMGESIAPLDSEAVPAPMHEPHDPGMPAGESFANEPGYGADQDDDQIEVNVALQPRLDDGSKLTQAAQVDTWSKLIADCGVSAMTKQLALHAQFAQQGQLITLVLPESKGHLDTPAARLQLKEALQQVLQHEVTLQITQGTPTNTPFAIQQKVNAVRLDYANAQLAQDRGVNLLKQEFNADIVTGTVKAR